MDDFEEYEQDEEIDTSDERQEVIDKSRNIYNKHNELKGKYQGNSNSQKMNQGTKQATKEGTKQAAKEAAKEGAKESAKQGAKEVAKEGAKEGAKAGAKEGAKAGAKVAASTGAKVGTEFIPVVGQIILVADLVVSAAKLIKKEIQKRKNEGADKKVKRKIVQLLPLILIASVFLLPIIAGIFYFSIGYTVTTYDSVERVYEFVECMQTADVCNEITGLKIKEEGQEKIQGFDKPLILFNKEEYATTANTYAEFSEKYFETGEGFFIDDLTNVSHDLSIDVQSQKELNSAVLATFLSLEARAFANIEWVEVHYSVEDGPVENSLNTIIAENPNNEEIYEAYFDTVYDSSKDDSNDTWLSWLFPKDTDEEYVIKIPDIKKYSQFEKKVVETDATFENAIGDEITIHTPPDDELNDVAKYREYLNYYFGEYAEMVDDYLPKWYEPYCMYLSTGDVTYAKKVYDEYIKLLKEDPIVIKLYNFNYKYNTTTTIETVNKYNNKQESEPPQYEDTYTQTEEIYYSPLVTHGYDQESILTDAYYNPYAPPVTEPSEPKIDNKITPESSGDLYPDGDTTQEPIGTYTSTITKTETVYTYQLPKIEHEIQQEGEGYASGKYLENKYANTRLAYIYSRICKDDGVDYNIDNIAPALEVVKVYYEKSSNVSNNITIPGVNGGIGGNNSVPAQPGVTNPYGGWCSTWTDQISGITYNEYTQDGAWYSGIDYGGYGNFGSQGCPITAASILLQGYGTNVDPGTLYKEVGVANPAQAVNWYLGKDVAISSGFSKDFVIDMLNDGKPISIHVPEMGPPLCYTYSGQHYMTLIGYNQDTGQVYLSTGNRGMPSGWYDISSSGIAGLYVDVIYYIPDENIPR